MDEPGNIYTNSDNFEHQLLQSEQESASDKSEHELGLDSSEDNVIDSEVDSDQNLVLDYEVDSDHNPMHDKALFTENAAKLVDNNENICYSNCSEN